MSSLDYSIHSPTHVCLPTQCCHCVEFLLSLCLPFSSNLSLFDVKTVWAAFSFIALASCTCAPSNGPACLVLTPHVWFFRNFYYIVILLKQRTKIPTVVPTPDRKIDTIQS